jgi:hypothetical protein
MTQCRENDEVKPCAETAQQPQKLLFFWYQEACGGMKQG